MRKKIKDKMDKVFEKQIETFTDKDKIRFRKLKVIMIDKYEDTILPVLLGLTFFWITRRIYLIAGFDYVIMFLGVVIVLSLRSLNSKIQKLIS